MSLKILMLEDSQEDAKLIQNELEKDGFRFLTIRVDSEQEFINGLQEFKPDVILSDHTLPQFNSQKALKICIDLGYSIPFILVTGAISEELAATIIKEGADDYILKKDLTKLRSAITLSLRRRQLCKEITEADGYLQKQKMRLETLNKKLEMLANSTYFEEAQEYSPKMKAELISITTAEIFSQEAIVKYMSKIIASMEVFKKTLIRTPMNSLK